MKTINRSKPAAAFVLAAALALLASACAGPPRLTNDGARPSTPSANLGGRAASPASPGLDIVATAAAGAVQSVDDPALGGLVELTVLRSYSAASGRICKNVSVRRTVDGGISGRVACQGAAGWYWSPVATG